LKAICLLESGFHLVSSIFSFYVAPVRLALLIALEKEMRREDLKEHSLTNLAMTNIITFLDG
jgi:hypothetical protein